MNEENKTTKKVPMGADNQAEKVIARGLATAVPTVTVDLPRAKRAIPAGCSASGLDRLSCLHNHEP
jgi:hypothetical protein